jgi:hypothetical protein
VDDEQMLGDTAAAAAAVREKRRLMPPTRRLRTSGRHPGNRGVWMASSPYSIVVDPEVAVAGEDDDGGRIPWAGLRG